MLRLTDSEFQALNSLQGRLIDMKLLNQIDGDNQHLLDALNKVIDAHFEVFDMARSASIRRVETTAGHSMSMGTLLFTLYGLYTVLERIPKEPKLRSSEESLRNLLKVFGEVKIKDILAGTEGAIH
jgi:hypothetical protein